MLDVLHYLLDEDLSFATGEEAKYKSAMRTSIYRNIYNMKYSYGVDKSESSDDYSNIDDGGMSREVKPYIPPTNFNPDAKNPFKGALREEPLG